MRRFRPISTPCCRVRSPETSQTGFTLIKLRPCTSVVEGLGALRNRLSDAHGQGKSGVKPASRHAELAVNLAGALAVFMLATREAQNETAA